jgi:hypothetical protein
VFKVFRSLIGVFAARAESKWTQPSSRNRYRCRPGVESLGDRISLSQIGFRAMSQLPGQPAGGAASIGSLANPPSVTTAVSATAALAGIKDQVNIQLDS